MITMSKIRVDEVETLRSLAIQTYTETFGHDTTAEQLAEFFAHDYSLERLTKELLSPESEHHFIYVDDKLAGYLKVNWGSAQTEQELENAFEIQRIYVLRAYQGYGLGKQLFTYALEIAEQRNFTWAWLGVWEHNYKAQNFYAKYGFEKFSEHNFVVSEDKIDTDWLLRKKLK